MKILVCGGRDYFDAERIDRVLDLIGPTLVIHGDARGADSMAANWAVKRGVPHIVAGFHTPEQQVAMGYNGRPDMLIAFPGAPGGILGRAMQRGVPTVELEDVK